MTATRPEIVCICGSARFVTQMRIANRELSFAGVIVLAPSEVDLSPTAEQKAVLDALHLRKIDLADRVLIVNPGGYVGESTRREIAYAEAAAARGLRAIIAGAGGAAHLPGMLAAKTTVPVLGVPVASRHLQGVDSLHSIVQMPKGIPVATFAIGNAGAANAALFAVAMLAATDATLRDKLDAFRRRQSDAARAMTQDLK